MIDANCVGCGDRISEKIDEGKTTGNTCVELCTDNSDDRIVACSDCQPIGCPECGTTIDR